MVADTFSPSITGLVGASTVTSNSGFLYSSTRNEPPPCVGHEDLINPSIASEGSSNEPSKPPNASAVNSLAKTLSPLGFWISTVKLGRRTPSVPLIIAGTGDPELEPNR